MTDEIPRCTARGEIPENPNSAPTPTDRTVGDGQKADHWVMCPSEIIKAGHKRPVRYSYVHVGPPGPVFPLRDLTPEEKARYGDDYAKYEPYPKEGRPEWMSESALGHLWTQEDLDKIGKGCGTVTRMGETIAQTYAADPQYYGSTWCCGCRAYHPVGRDGEFVWDGTDQRVGT